MQKEIHESTPVGKPEKILKSYSEFYEDRKTKLLAKIIRHPPQTPFVTVHLNSIHINRSKLKIEQVQKDV